MGSVLVHQHDGRSFRAYRCTVDNCGIRSRRVPKATVVAYCCFYCGFTPSETFKRIQRAVLEKHIRGE